MIFSPPPVAHPSKPTLARLASLALVTALVACGGSSGGGPTAPGRTSVAQIEASLVQMANTERGAMGLAPLTPDPALAAIARAHSEAMRDAGFFDHVNLAGQSYVDRLRASGQPFSAAGENLAVVSHSNDPANLAHVQLMQSSVHRAAILNPTFQVVGVGVAQAGDNYWVTQLFVRR